MKRVILSIILVYVVFASWCQNVTVRDMHYHDMSFYNPAYTKTDTINHNAIQIYGKYAIVDKTVSGGVTTPYVSLEYEGRSYRNGGHYFGAYSHDTYSWFVRHSVSGGYGYSWFLGNGLHQISIGGRLSLYIDDVDFDKFAGSDIEGRKVYVTPDADLGIHYRYTGLCVGIGYKNLAYSKNRVTSDKAGLYCNVSYDFEINNWFEIAPLALISYQHSRGMLFNSEIGCWMRFAHIAEFSYIYSMMDFRHITMLNLNIPKTGLYFGAAFDASTLYSDMNVDFRLGYRF